MKRKAQQHRVKTIMRNAWWIILVFGLIALIITSYFGDEDSPVFLNVTVLVITLAVLVRYAFDTYRLAEATEIHLRYQSTPVVSVSIDHRLYDPASAKSANPTTVIYITNDSRYHLEVKVRIVLQYGGHKAVHTDRYYSGQTIWNIGPKENSNGNFKILPFFESIGDISASMIDKLNQSNQRLKIFILSEYKIYERNDDSYTQNMPRTYWLKSEAVPNNLVIIGSNVTPLPFVWVYEFESPQEEIKQLAMKDR